MAKTPSQIQAELRRIQQKQRQAVDNANRAIRQFNDAVKRDNDARSRAIDEHNRKVRAHNAEVDRRVQAQARAVDSYNQKVRQHNTQVERDFRQRQAATRRAIDQYNSAVRQHNARVQSKRNRQQADLARLQSRTVAPQYVVYRDSTADVHAAYEQMGPQAEGISPEHALLRSMSERESQRSIDTANLLVGDELPETNDQAAVEDDTFVEALREFSEDLAQRWQGATYAMSPANPDAARHFCTSVREIFTTILDTTAPDADVLQHSPDCQKAPNGTTPSRRSKIAYLMSRKGITDPKLAAFADADIKNVLSLFDVFNKATHGAAGKYALEKLQAIRVRVKEGVLFLTSIATAQ